jgi:hypothetical protein
LVARNRPWVNQPTLATWFKSQSSKHYKPHFTYIGEPSEGIHSSHRNYFFGELPQVFEKIKIKNLIDPIV